MHGSKSDEVIEYLSLTNIFAMYPIVICFTSFMFYKHRNKPFFVHRNRIMMVLFCCCLGLGVFTSSFPAILSQGHLIIARHFSDDVAGCQFMWAVFLHQCTLLFFARSVFELMVRIKHAQVTQKWRCLLQREYAQKSCLIRHYRKLVNPKSQFVLIATVLAVSNTLSTILLLATGDFELATLPGFITVLGVLVLIIVSLCTIGQFNDFWYIRLEIWCEIGIFTLLLLPIFIATLAGVTTHQFGLIRSFGFTIVYPLLHAFVVLFPICINERKHHSQQQCGGRGALFEYIEDINKYERLMEHLTKELSLENLLFITEVLQFRAYLITSEHATMFDSNKLRAVFTAKPDLQLPSAVPTSSIFVAVTSSQIVLDVERMNSINSGSRMAVAECSSSDIYGGVSPTPASVALSSVSPSVCQIFLALYDKYLDEKSALQLNISHAQQLSLYHRSVVIRAELSKPESFSDCDASAIGVTEIWNDLLATVNEILPCLRESLTRCPKKIV